MLRAIPAWLTIFQDVETKVRSVVLYARVPRCVLDSGTGHWSSWVWMTTIFRPRNIASHVGHNLVYFVLLKTSPTFFPPMYSRLLPCPK